MVWLGWTHGGHVMAIGSPPVRRLQIFTLDPGGEAEMDQAVLGRSTLTVKWEPLKPGPIGEYLEVIDVDPSSKRFYEPVDLDSQTLLATDGIAPSAGDPRFHQQMVYAIAMNTIAVFESVLGRPVIWSERVKDDDGEYIEDLSLRYVKQLRLYPHALRSTNAYYSPGKKAVLFGYYNATSNSGSAVMAGGIAFTCLSHDIVVHEVTHAILDSVHPKLLHSSNHDMLAFHEGFADIVAIFQHFSLPNLLLEAIESTRGDLKQNNILAKLAVQFARTTGRGDALRDALGYDENGVRKKPSGNELEHLHKPHDRGAILVAAIFDAYLLIYDSRVQDLRRIATNGTGVLPAGEIHPDLAKRFASEAVKIAQRVLTICIRAIDYLPPVDVTYGDYFRALITADRDVVPYDRHHYRIAFIESFKEKGIYPFDVRTLSENALRWKRIDEINDHARWQQLAPYFPPKEVLKTMVLNPALRDGAYEALQKREFTSRQDAIDFYLHQTWQASVNTADTDFEPTSRFEEYRFSRFNAEFVRKWILFSFENEPELTQQELTKLLGVSVPTAEMAQQQKAKFEVLSIRRLVRPKPDGISKVELFVSVSMRTLETLVDKDGMPMKDAHGTDLTFFFRSGATLIVDPDIGRIRYAIKKNHRSEMAAKNRHNRLERQRAFFRSQIEQEGEMAVKRFGLTADANEVRAGMEAFSVAHDH